MSLDRRSVGAILRSNNVAFAIILLTVVVAGFDLISRRWSYQISHRVTRHEPDLAWAAGPAGDVTLVTRLLSKGADPNETDRWGVSALERAVDWDRPNTVALLLEAGADAGRPTSNGTLLVETAKTRNHWRLVELLLQYGAPDTDTLDALLPR